MQNCHASMKIVTELILLLWPWSNGRGCHKPIFATITHTTNVEVARSFGKVVNLLPLISLLHIVKITNFSHNKTFHYTVPLTSVCWVHSNIYVLDKTKSIRYHTSIDPFCSTSSAMQMYHHMTSVSVEIPPFIWTGNSSSIGEEPVS